MANDTATSITGPTPSRVNGSRRLGRRPRPEPASTASPAAAVSPPPKLRRHPALLALGVALAALGGLAAAWVTTTVGHTRAVLALAAPVARGELLTAADLTVARINADPALHTVPAAGRDTLVGKRAAVDLAAGSLLTPQSVTTVIIPAAGQSLVGVTVTPAQLPAQPLRPGDHVRIVDTPRAQDQPPAAAPAVIPATVVDTRPLADNGQLVVDVTVPAGIAADLAAHVATARIALVLDSGVR